MDSDMQKKFFREDDAIYLIDYLEIVAKHSALIVRATVSVSILSVVVSLIMPNVYSASAKILPPSQDAASMAIGLLTSGSSRGLGGVANDLLGKGTDTDLYVGILASESIKDAVIEKLKLIELFGKKYRSDVYRELDKKVVIEAGKKDGIITITVYDKNPKLSAEIANVYVSELDKLLVGINYEEAVQNRNYLEVALSKARIDLSNAEDDLKKFQYGNKVVSVTDQAQASILALSQVKAQLTLAELDLLNLKRRFTDSSQEVKSAKVTIDSLRGQMTRLEGASESSGIPSVGAIPELGVQYMRLLRNFKIQEALVELLTKQYEMTRLVEAKKTVGVKVIQNARIPDKKIKPKRSLIVLVCTFTFAFSAIVFAIIYESFKLKPIVERERWLRLRAMLRC